ncbi:gamma carbonic anhydrase family protein [Paraburkholderia dilworthii]|uniref:gamma carbonic anhydrase family protein n=1 Tax=Paraburkholderia dilworthii TaxID=948106 RepID=UPI0004194211|nr:gamma carbonic anhydrase family protein [Paraburkholderia dilworthii]
MAIYSFRDHSPAIHPDAYVSGHAVVIGNVEIAEGVSIWPGVIIRGDNEKILIGANSNIQDGAVVHADLGFPVVIGSAVSVGHAAMLHGCTIGSSSLVGIQAVVLNGAVIGARCLVGACSLVPQGKRFLESSLILGNPAKALRALTDDDAAFISLNAEEYVERARRYKSELRRIG